jgi:hypothetical protein
MYHASHDKKLAKWCKKSNGFERDSYWMDNLAMAS